MLEKEILVSRVCLGNYIVYIFMVWLSRFLLRFMYLLYLILFINGVNFNFRLCFMIDGKNYYFCYIFYYFVLWGKLEYVYVCVFLYLDIIKMIVRYIYVVLFFVMIRFWSWFDYCRKSWLYLIMCYCGGWGKGDGVLIMVFFVI